MTYAAVLAHQGQRLRLWNLALLTVAGAGLLLFAAWVLRSGDVGQALLMAVALAAGLLGMVLVWRNPRAAVYVLFAAAVVVEVHPLGGGLSITDRIPAFHNLQTLLPLPGLILNPVECLVLLSLGVVLLKGRVGRGERVELGSLGLPFALLLAVIALGVVKGITAGGDVRIALWGVRALLLLFLTYLLTVNLVRERGHVRILFAVLVIGVAIKALIGLWRYAVDFGGSIGAQVETGVPGNALMAHTESFFFLMLAFLAVLAFALRLPRRDRRLALIGLLIVLVPLLANHRRVAIAALLLATLALLIVLYALEPSTRRAIVAGVLVAFMVLPAYGALTWNSTSLVALPVQAVKSSFDPDARDASSNHYRDIENHNMRAMARQSPLLGVGFGVPMVQHQVLPDISQSYEWYLYLPHNGLLWLGMTTGIVGLAVFLYFAASLLLRSVAAIRAAEGDAELRCVFIVGLLSVVGYLTFVLFDQGILNERLSIFLGVQAGLLAVAPRLISASSRPPVSSPAGRERERRLRTRATQPADHLFKLQGRDT